MSSSHLRLETGDYLCLETGARIVRVVEPSRVRRGRMATSPVWRVTLSTGEIWQFQRRKDALAFATVGGCPSHDGICLVCKGHKL